jgi:type IV pilus assembly protein PilF
MPFSLPTASLKRGVGSGFLHLLTSGLLSLSMSLLVACPAKAQMDARIQAHLDLATAYLHAELFSLAMLETDQVLAVSPQLPEGFGLKAVIYQKQGRLALAGSFFQKASHLAPRSAQIAHNWGVFECEQGFFESAFLKFELAQRHSEGLERDKSLWVWGVCLLQNQQWEAAHLKMNESFLRQPGFISEALVLASLKIQLGRDAEAEKILDKVNDSPSVSAQSLWLSVQLAQRQNQAVKKNHWGKMLGLLFSNSVQWRAYQAEASHD